VHCWLIYIFKTPNKIQEKILMSILQDVLLPCLVNIVFAFLPDDERHYINNEWNSIQYPIQLATFYGLKDLLLFNKLYWHVEVASALAQHQHWDLLKWARSEGLTLTSI
jgi:hypothetical protein